MQSRELNHLLPALRMIAVRALGDHLAAEHLAQEALVLAILSFNEQPSHIAGIVHRILAESVGTERPYPGTLARAVSDSDVEVLRGLLRELSEDDRELLQLTYVDGLSSEDVARRVDEDEAFIHELRTQVLEHLRARLANTFVRDEVGVVLQFGAKEAGESEVCRQFERDGVIARYVAGNSDKNETPAFELHFLECRQCLEDVIVGAAVRLSLTT